MPFIEVPVGDAKEPETVPEAIYELRIEGATEKRNKDNTRDLLVANIAVMNPPDGITPSMIFHQIALPNEDDEPKSRDFMLLLLRRFLAVFDVPYESSGFNTDDLPGSSGKCPVGLEAVVRDGVETGEKRNVLRLPPLKSEKQAPKKAAKKVA